MQGGAGIKLKTVEAIMRGMPLVTTRSGMVGCGFVDRERLMQADAPEEFTAAVRALLSNEEAAQAMVSRAQEFVRHNYDQKLSRQRQSSIIGSEHVRSMA